ncbi:hypothetical protein Ddye_013098 [Dipteronia dyeriana]|uniref:Myb-like domain-containing protein n=1 Tax=Dipteronia dyeriana TaxID=168575 RepID=A0AAD9X5T2_9ROSI|nr:hypothetical protein Ddye_013098 [Dipteronia dyeriana]
MMDIVGYSSSHDSSLPWLWIIEYLAGFKEIDTSILQELVEMAPESPDDLAKSTREMVALRCLEDMFDSGDGLNKDAVSDVENKTVIDLSQSCEDVLQHILQMIPEADLKMAGPELSKWDVHPFIMHKRATMRKCALQQLKDTILEGTHPLAGSLKKSSGLICANECGRSHADDAYHNAPTLRFDGFGTNPQSMAANGNLIPPTCENGNGLSGDNLQNDNLLPSKRDRNDLTSEDTAGHPDEIQEESDHHANAKKLKRDAVRDGQSVKQISVPPHGNESLEDFSARVVGVTEGEGCDFVNQSRDEIMEESQCPEDGHDECVDSGMPGQNGDVNDGELQNSQKVVGHVADKMPQDTFVDESVDKVIADETNVTELRKSTGAPSTATQRKDSVNESKGEMEHLREEEVSSDNDEYHNETIDVDMKKSHFLSSQCSLGNDTLATAGWTEQNLCVKCNKDGQLLYCNTSSCPLAVHENCLGFPANFDENGNFYCPFCACSLANSEYLEAKKKASLARKKLTAFVHMGLEHRPGKLAESSHRKDYTHSEQKGHNKIGENGQLRDQEKERTNQNGQHGHDLTDSQCQKCLCIERQSEPSASCVDVNLPCSDEVANAVDETLCVSNGDKVGEENMANKSPSVRGVEEQQDQIPANPKCDADNLSCINSGVGPVDQREAEEGIEKEDFRQASSDPPEKPVIALNIDAEETSEGENYKYIISSYYVRSRRRERQYTYPSIPQLRRKKVPWTTEEEEILKMGVKKFTRLDDRNIPWKKIMEFGSSVFLRGRTTIDLKDKWRNMCKGSPKSK